MSENYIVINGKCIELTDEQLKTLGIEEKIPWPFPRLNCKDYYYIDETGEVKSDTETFDSLDDWRYSIANYCINESLMKQRALQETLNRLLWRFACETGELENKWNGRNDHYYICRDSQSNELDIGRHWESKGTEIYFSSPKTVQLAIDSIVKPFMNEHPEFVW